jgi:hypothetical protein
MAHQPSIDGVLIRWGERLFYPGNRIVKPVPQPRLREPSTRVRAAAIRARIQATIVRRAPQVMVKVTGGGRGMKAIAAHFRYISKNGRLDIEDDEGNVARGRDGIRELLDDWHFAGTLIEDVADRREAFNVMLSMPRGTEPLIVLRAAREFAESELADHKYVMVLHDHQANPHVHISVRAESKLGKRLNPRKTDLHRWRETFAEKLRGRGVEAEASRQASRGALRNFDPLWCVKASADGRLARPRYGVKSGKAAATSRSQAGEAWGHIAQALLTSGDLEDRSLGQAIINFARDASLDRSPRLERQEPPLARPAPVPQVPTMEKPSPGR